MLLQERLKGYRLILASASPRRRQLLADCDLKFEVAPKFECDESFPDIMPSDEVAEYLSGVKSDAYPCALVQGEVLITADTVVVVEDEILGKPADKEEAAAMLGRLSGRSHRVITGVTLRSCDKRVSFSVASTVTFRVISQEEIDYYIEVYKPFDKAGAYGIQEWIGCVAIEGIDGSFYNVMGLPVQRLYVELEKFLG
ncbi:MAG: septum formation protein Maf [Alistipes sp.]|nr:septum formation protein Maf [Alistipes sp.]